MKRYLICEQPQQLLIHNLIKANRQKGFMDLLEIADFCTATKAAL